MPSRPLLSSQGKQLQLTLATLAYFSQLLVYLPYEIQIRGETWGQLPATSYACLQSAELRTSISLHFSVAAADGHRAQRHLRYICCVRHLTKTYLVSLYCVYSISIWYTVERVSHSSRFSVPNLATCESFKSQGDESALPIFNTGFQY